MELVPSSTDGSGLVSTIRKFSMLSKNNIKRLNKLSLKKNRLKERQFLVEGDKMILELASSDYEIAELFVTSELETSVRKTFPKNMPVHVISIEELKKISQLKTPQNSLAVCRIPETPVIPLFINDALSLYIDSIQDPGNLGTILRISDWFGIQNVFVSPETVDVFNPKVIQASMGSFARVRVYETGFETVENLAKKSQAIIYGAFMEGSNVYEQTLAGKAILVVGNEGNGIRPEIEARVDHKLSIPNFSLNDQKAESLNVSVATAVLCSEFKRKH